jgi:hypothetical protein
MMLEKVTVENYEELAPKIARKKFPIGKIVIIEPWLDFIYAGRVKSISKIGRVSVVLGEIQKSEIEEKEGKKYMACSKNSFRISERTNSVFPSTLIYKPEFSHFEGLNWRRHTNLYLYELSDTFDDGKVNYLLV